MTVRLSTTVRNIEKTVSNPRKLCDSQKKMKRLKEQIEKEKDPEVKAELKK
jgi:hypothetical protein